MEFIYFEDSWNEEKNRNIQQRGTSSTGKKKDDTEGSRRPDQVHKKN